MIKEQTHEELKAIYKAWILGIVVEAINVNFTNSTWVQIKAHNPGMTDSLLYKYMNGDEDKGRKINQNIRYRIKPNEPDA